MPQRWEYAVLTMDAGGNMFWVGYSGPGSVSNMDHPLRDFGSILGEMGDKGWELVSVAQSANQQGGSTRSSISSVRTRRNTN